MMVDKSPMLKCCIEKLKGQRDIAQRDAQFSVCQKVTAELQCSFSKAYKSSR